MPRRPRIQLAGGIFHLTGRGNRRQAIVRGSADARLFLDLLDVLASVRGWIAHSYCLMPNHYHLVVETPQADLSRGMQWLNGTYAQAFNWRHTVDGHLFQGRFHSVLVEGDAHLLELSRYVALNPVRAGLCRDPATWQWASYRALLGREKPRRILATDRILTLFGAERRAARERYRSFVEGALLRPQT